MPDSKSNIRIATVDGQDVPMTVSDLIAHIKAHIKYAQDCERKSFDIRAHGDEHWHAAGLALKQLKELKPKGARWPAYVREHFDLSKERADELIRIAEGRTTVKKTRERKRQSMRRTRARAPRGTQKAAAKTRRLPTSADVHALMSRLFEFYAIFEEGARRWKENGDFSHQDKIELINAIHQTANNLTLLAQELED